MGSLKPADSSGGNLFDEYALYTNDFEAELTNNLTQLKYIIEYASTASASSLKKSSLEKLETLSTSSSNTSSNSSSNQNSESTGKATNFNQLNTHYKTLLDLFEYYKRLKQNLNASANGELKFVQYLIIKRLNYLNNNLFGINKRLIVDFNTNELLASNQNLTLHQSPLIQFFNYDQFGQFEYNLANAKPASLKLIVNSINMSQFNGNNLIASTSGDEFNIIIYQFEKKQSVLAAVKNNQPEKSKKTSKKLTFSSKRSSSADTRGHNSLKLKSNQKNTDTIDSIRLAGLYLDSEAALAHTLGISSSEESLSDLENDLSNCGDLQLLSSKFRLGEKCLSTRSVKFNQNLATNVHSSIDLKQNCEKIIVIIYKLVKVNDEYLRFPLKYESYELIANANDAAFLMPTGSRVVSFETNTRTTVSNSDPTQANSSVFRRMFNKSKSTTRRTSTSRFRSTTASQAPSSGDTKYDTLGRKRVGDMRDGGDIENDSFLTMSISSSRQVDIFLNESSNLVNIDIFDYWRGMWRPNVLVSQNNNSARLDLNNKEKCAEIVNIFLKSIRFTDLAQDASDLAASAYGGGSHGNRRSKLDQYQLSKKKTGTLSKF
jgi:hypothetical protein